MKPLHPVLSETLSLFRGKARFSAREVSDRLSLEPTTSHARLERLRRLGLLDRAYANPGWEYFRARKGAGR